MRVIVKLLSQLPNFSPIRRALCSALFLPLFQDSFAKYPQLPSTFSPMLQPHNREQYDHLKHKRPDSPILAQNNRNLSLLMLYYSYYRKKRGSLIFLRAGNTYPIYQSGSNFATPLTAVTGPGNKQWWAISASDDGQYILAGTCNYNSNNTNELWRSSNGGSTWIKV